MKVNPFIETMVYKASFSTPFAANVANSRKELRYLQRDLAKKMKVSNTTIVNWERGTSTPTLPMFARLCTVLKKTPNELLGASQ